MADMENTGQMQTPALPWLVPAGLALACLRAPACWLLAVDHRRRDAAEGSVEEGTSGRIQAAVIN